MRLEQFLNESINDKGIFKAVFMTGTPGAGKSFLLKKISTGDISPRITNSDKMTEFFKAYGSEGWNTYREKVKLITKNQLVNYWNSLLPLWVDGTSSNSVSLFSRDKILKTLGYDTAMIWVDTPLDDALARAKNREKEMGRSVDPDWIVDTYKRLGKLKLYYASKFNHFTEILNGEGELIDKVIIQAYRKMSKFFLSPIKNPRGITTVNIMKENGWKYLLDGVYDKSYLNKLANRWFI
jgi:hypothetical protein